MVDRKVLERGDVSMLNDTLRRPRVYASWAVYVDGHREHLPLAGDWLRDAWGAAPMVEGRVPAAHARVLMACVLLRAARDSNNSDVVAAAHATLGVIPAETVLAVCTCDLDAVWAQMKQKLDSNGGNPDITADDAFMGPVLMLPFVNPEMGVFDAVRSAFEESFSRSAYFVALAAWLVSFAEGIATERHGADSVAKLAFWLRQLEGMCALAPPSALLVPALVRSLERTRTLARDAAGPVPTLLIAPSPPSKDDGASAWKQELGSSSIQDAMQSAQEVLQEVPHVLSTQRQNAVPITVAHAEVYEAMSGMPAPAKEDIVVPDAPSVSRIQMVRPDFDALWSLGNSLGGMAAVSAAMMNASRRSRPSSLMSPLGFASPQPSAHTSGAGGLAVLGGFMATNGSLGSTLPREYPTRSKYNPVDVQRMDVHAVFAQIEEVWLQVDPIVARLASRQKSGGASAGRDEAEAEVMVSTMPGTLSITRLQVFWEESQRPNEMLVASPSRGMQRSNSELLGGPLGMEAEAARPPLQVGLGDVMRFGFFPVKHAGNAFYLVMHTTQQAFKFFPFYDGEVQELTAAFTDLTGSPPFDEREYVRAVMEEEMAAQRTKVLAKLSAEFPDETWLIDNNPDLHAMLAKLADDSKPQNMYDMERLFHSCRLNREVTRETLQQVRYIWHETREEPVRLRVLSIMDRLLDRAVLHVGDDDFKYAAAWLRKIQSQLDPYTNAGSLEVLDGLLKRVVLFKKQAVKGIPVAQFAEHFDYLAEFREYRRSRIII